MVHEISFLLFIACLTMYVFSNIYMAKTNRDNPRTRLNKIYDEWVNSRLKAASHIVTVQSLRNFIMSNSVFVSGLLILLGLIVGLIGSDYIDEATLFFEIEGLSVGLVQIATNIVVIIYCLLNFIISIRMYNRFTILVTANPEQSCIDNPDDIKGIDLMQNAFKMAQKRFMQGTRGIYFLIAALSWLLNPLLFLAISATATIYILFFEDYGKNRTKKRNIHV